jgi:Rrf2 family iron-sulfur cluster assembly transcriptional regulator
MQLSTRGRYAVMAMVDLATQQVIGCECGPVCLAEIAARQRLSLSYLEQLFGKLRRAGLVGSARGPGGGYRLARGSDTISVAAIIAAVDEPIQATRCQGDGGCIAVPDSAPLGERCQTHDLWHELGRQIALFLDGITLADVVAGRVQGRAVPVADAVAPELRAVLAPAVAPAVAAG